MHRLAPTLGLAHLSIHGAIMKKALFLISAASLLLLQACGGGGSDDASASNTGGGTTNTPNGNGGNGTTAIPGGGGNDASASNTGGGATANTPDGNGGNGTTAIPGGGGDTGTVGNNTGGADQGSVSAPFTPITVDGEDSTLNTSNYLIMGPTFTDYGSLGASQQDAGGAMTTLGANVLSGDYAVQDITGDASFAMGRWVKGSVTLNGGGTDTLTGTDGRTYHYLAYIAYKAQYWPPGVFWTCNEGGHFTTPTYTSGGSHAALTGTSVTASATESSYFAGYIFPGSLTVNANGETANVAFPNVSVTTAGSPMTHIENGNGSGVGMQLVGPGSANPDLWMMVIQYAALMPSGARYIGLGYLDCQVTGFF
jgi:hypothetical protein